MLVIYRGLINALSIFSPLIVFFRIKNKKEDPLRYKEKFAVRSKDRKKGKLIWFHGSSVGELLSVIPLIRKCEKNKKIKQILVTSSTLSSASVFKKFKFQKTIHQFFPIDTKHFIKKFLNYWKPTAVFFIESEIWPNSIHEINKANIKLILINARITKKSFKRWIFFKKFSNFLFGKFDICLSQSKETFNYLKILGAKKIKSPGNLKFSEHVEKENLKLNYNLNNFLKNKKKIFGAISTHNSEEIFCAEIHKELKKTTNSLLTIIIPRHVERCEQIIADLNKYKFKIHKHSSKKKIRKETEIYLVDTFGETKSFLKKCSVVFLGGSLVERGGQNPLEAARFGCKVLHGPYISNFREVYDLLKKYQISYQIINKLNALRIIHKFFNKKQKKNLNLLRLNSIGKNILDKNYNEIKRYI